MNIATTLKELRLDANLTQKELAKKLNIGQSTITQYERGDREPTIHNLSLYANFFGVSVDYILGLDGGTESASVAPMGETLTAAERELLACFRKLTHGMQEVILTTVRAMTGEDGSALQKKA